MHRTLEGIHALARVQASVYKRDMAQLLKPGQKLADYEILDLVGQGGMGEVYRARQLSMQRIVALKALAPRLAKKDPIFAKRFVEEARAAGRLNHANIVAVHDVDQTQIETADGLRAIDFFSMEFVDGESVKDVIEREGACKLPLVERVMLGMAEALIYAESQNVIHRDIKPDNIMITGEGVIKLADLGLAVQAGADSVNDQRDEHGRAKVMGTPLYMSPEQARALPLDPRSDQYSLGGTLFHMLTGQPPFRGEDPRSVMRAHVFNPVPDPGALRPELPEGWCRLCRRLMAKKPEDRFLNARELKYAVESVVAGHDSDVDSRPRPAVKPLSERPLVLAGLVGGGVALAILALVWALWGPSRSVHSGPIDPRSDPVIAAEQRVKEALAHLPGEPEDALAAIERLAADPANQPAKPYLDIARTAQKNLLAGKKHRDALALSRKARLKLEAVQKLIETGHLTQAIKDMPDSNAVTNDLLPLRANLVKSTEALTAARREAVNKKLMAANEDALDAVLGDIATIDMADVDKEALRASVEARRKALKEEGAKKSALEETAAWRTVADLADEKRGTCFDLGNLVNANQGRFNAPSSLVMVKAVIEVQPLIDGTNRLLVNYLANERPSPEMSAIVDGTADLVRVSRMEETTVSLAKVQGGELRTLDRRVVVLPLGELVAKAVAKSSAALDRRGLAAYLWMCRAPEAKAALAALGEDPLARALELLENLAPRLAVIATVQRSERRITVKYAFNPQARLLQGDFSAEGLSLAKDALLWLAAGGTAKGSVPMDDAKLPTLRWQGKLRAPLEWTVGLRMRTGAHTVLVGFDAGKIRVRLGLAPRPLPGHPALNLIVTGKNGALARAGDDRLDWTPHPVDGYTPVQVKLSVDDKGRLAAVVDGNLELPTTSQATLPTGTDLTPIIQVVQAGDLRTEVQVTDLLFCGELPGAR